MSEHRKKTYQRIILYSIIVILFVIGLLTAHKVIAPSFDIAPESNHINASIESS